MKKLLFIVSLLFSFSGFSQIIKDTLAMKDAKQKRSITISLPESYKKDTKKTYPLLLLLDGDYLLDPFNGVLKYGNYWGDLPEVIIVGIDQNVNNERYDDTETSEEGLPEKKGSKFYEFIGNDLIPYIQQKYRLNTFKIIAGHDVTAGFLNFYLYKDAPLFNAYISLSPEFPFDMEKRIPARLDALKQSIFYYQAVADGDNNKIKSKINEVNDVVKTFDKTTLNYKFDEIKSTSHYSMVLQAIPNALYHFFDGFQPINTNEYNEKIVNLPSGYVEYLNKRYEKLEKAFGYKLNVRLTDFKAIESAILKNKAYNEYEELAVVANKNFPKAMLGDYYLAQYFERREDFKKATKYYLSAFQMEPIGDLTREMMMEKSEKYRNQIKKEKNAEKANKKNGKVETPTETPVEVPAETPVAEPVKEEPKK